MRAGPISSSRKSFGSLPSWCAISATNDWVDQACITLLTERNQPMRVWLCASPLSMRMFGTLNGVSTHPMPSSMSNGCFGSGAKVDRNARRRAAMPPRHHLVAGVEPRLEAIDRHGVIEAVPDVVLARPHHLDRRAAQLPRQQRRLDREVAFRLAAEAAAEQRACARIISSGLMPSALAMSSRAPPGLCTGAHTSHLPPLMRAIAAGGSMVACARCGA